MSFRPNNKTSSNSADETVDRLIVNRELNLPVMSTAVRDQLQHTHGDIIHNTDLDQLQYYNGGSWVTVESSVPGGTSWQLGGNNTTVDSNLGLTSNNKLNIITNNIPRIAIDGNGLINISSSAGIKNTEWAQGTLLGVGSGNVLTGRILTSADIPILGYSKLNLTGSIVSGDIISIDGSKLTGGISRDRLNLTGSVADSDIISLDGSKLTGSVPYARLNLAGSIVNSDIVSLDFNKLYNTPSVTGLKVASGTLRIRQAANVFQQGDYIMVDNSFEPNISVRGGGQNQWSSSSGGVVCTLFVTGFNNIYSYSLTQGPTDQSDWVAIPKVDSKYTEIGGTYLDVILYSSYDGSRVTQLGFVGNCDIYITVFGE